MSAYGQSPCEWCRVMIEDQEIHKCQRSDLREHIGDLRHRLAEKVPASAVPEVSEDAVMMSLKKIVSCAQSGADLAKYDTALEYMFGLIGRHADTAMRAALAAAFGKAGKS